jgi:3-dehydro-L-gulonate 2-dehydrogenase
MHISFQELKAEFYRVLIKLGFTEHKADFCARIFAENSRDGVYTHGLNRFPAFTQHVKNGLVNINAKPELLNNMGALEQWDGNLAPGIFNAEFCMDRAIHLASENGIGCVAIKNTNHWMRGGTYGWQAAEAGFIGICITNSIANMVPWGGTTNAIANNPLIIALPRTEGHVVLDMAISQYSKGKVLQYQSFKEQLPFVGGYDNDGNLTKDPDAIVSSKRLLPIGMWKGSALSMVLDMLVSALSLGKTVKQITTQGNESAASQLFIAIKPFNKEQVDQLINEVIDFTRSSAPADPDKPVLYPGENALQTRVKSVQEGVFVDEKIWAEVKGL